MGIKSEFEALMEKLREDLVALFGDHATVHTAVDDAKASIEAAHTPVDEEPAALIPTNAEKQEAKKDTPEVGGEASGDATSEGTGEG